MRNEEKRRGASKMQKGDEIVMKSEFKSRFGGRGRRGGIGWEAELKAASAAPTNSFTKTLWRFRKDFRRVRRENVGYLNEMWHACQNSEDGVTCYSGLERMLSEGSLQRISGDADVLAPILEVLPHLRLAVPGKLDCNVSGGRWGAHSCFVVRKDESAAPLSVALDGSVDSAWERILLHIAESQFYLGWHAGYEEFCIVTDVRRFAQEANISFAGEEAWEKICKAGRARMLKNDFAPEVAIANGVASVSYYIFSAFGGLFHVVDEVDMKTGNVLPEHVKFDNVVEYDCGVCY